jgi:hypothetical protein
MRSERRSRAGFRAAPPPLLVAVVASVLIVLTLAAPVQAALFVRLDRTAAAPGTLIHGVTGGEGAFASDAPPKMEVFLARAAVADAISARDDPRLTVVAVLQVNSFGDGWVTFRVPQLAAGRYTLLLDCPTCAAYSAGRVMVPVATLRITALPDSSTVGTIVPRSAAIDTWVLLPILTLAVLLLLVAAEAATRRRRRRAVVAFAGRTRPA